MGSGFAKMKKQARMMEEQMEKMREEMKNKEITGSAGNGLVQVVMNGEKEVKSIKIRPECIDPADPEGLQDLIIAAFHDAHTQLVAQDSSSSPFSLPFSF
jgi:DNA-binding YbaB/EbfC family protein